MTDTELLDLMDRFEWYPEYHPLAPLVLRVEVGRSFSGGPVYVEGEDIREVITAAKAWHDTTYAKSLTADPR